MKMVARLARVRCPPDIALRCVSGGTSSPTATQSRGDARLQSPVGLDQFFVGCFTARARCRTVRAAVTPKDRRSFYRCLPEQFERSTPRRSLTDTFPDRGCNSPAISLKSVCFADAVAADEPGAD